MWERAGRSGIVVALSAVLVVTGQTPAGADEPSGPTSPSAAPAAAEPSVTWPAPTVQTEVARGLELVATTDGVDPSTTAVVVERRAADQDVWDAVASRTDGARVTVAVPGEPATYRARLVRDEQTIATATTAVTTRPARTKADLTLPRSVRDYSKVTAKVTWRRLFDGVGPSGTAVLEYKPTRTAKYRTRARIRVVSGAGSFRFAPRNDGWYRVRIPTSNQRLAPSASGRRWIDNRPPGKAVALPKGSPRPTYRVPKQTRATRIAADARISPISARVWRSMKGRSWHRGCPVGRGDLRVVRVSYWSYDGYVRRGEIVVNRSVARRTARVFTDLFKRRTPIRSMYRVDRFGWSRSLKGADDVRSMRAGNTSGFNCRQVVGNTGVRSPHSYGRSIDINPWENPYWAGRWYPNSWWHSRSRPANVTWRSHSDPVVRIFRKHGFGWLGVFDLHHFQD